MKIFFRIVLLITLLFGVPFFSQGAVMKDYCQLPSSLLNVVPPNVLFLIDKSYSMSYCAYTSNEGACPVAAGTEAYNSSVTYEGYFIPDEYYELNGDGVYVVAASPGTCTTGCVEWDCFSYRFGTQCDIIKGTHGCRTNRYACCTEYGQTGACTGFYGNYLNYEHMKRIDILRWALTGGRLSTCDTNATDERCNADRYIDKPAQLSDCDSYGCILTTWDGTKVKAPWRRINGVNPATGKIYTEAELGINPKTGLTFALTPGLLFQLKTNLETKPYVGAMFFNGTGITSKIYIGDFTASQDIDTANPFKNLITYINYEQPSSAQPYTPTSPAMWDAYNYFAQNNPQYGGLAPDSGGGNQYRNPMYRCVPDSPTDTNCSGNFVFFPCAKNFVILLTDGQWNRGGSPVQASCRIDGDAIATESPDPVVPAYKMHKEGFVNAETNETSYVESVYTIGLWLGGYGEQSLKNVAMYGSFDRTKTWPGGLTGYPLGECGPVTDCCDGPPHLPGSPTCGKGSSCAALPVSSSDWDSNGDGVPDTFYAANNAAEIKNKLAKIILEIMLRVSSGSAISILSSSEGTGANLLQAVYYPRKQFGTKEIEWTGEMQNLWYYVDPYLESSTIREDTNIAATAADPDAGRYILNLGDDYVIEMFFDDIEGKTKAQRYSTDDEGGTKTSINEVLIEDVKNLWEAGTMLFQRTSARTIFTTTNGSTNKDFISDNWSDLRRYLQAADETEARKIIEYIRGDDKTGYRDRTVTIGGVSAEWKLGDIVNSSPRLQSPNPLNSYHKKPPDGYADDTYRLYIQDTPYSTRGMSYIGANDGMLHAFRHGKLEQTWAGQNTDEKARLVNPDYAAGDDSTYLGAEVWSFIPKNALPYLKYLADPDYCHLFYVDGSSIIIDASIENVDTTNGTTPDDYSLDAKAKESWKTVLIGGMGLGGASKITGSSCTTGSAGTCVKTPITDPVDTTGNTGLGYSSYYALDVSNPKTPSVMWEFAHPTLGFSTTGPAILRIGDVSKNGKWFAMFASGPTGPIDTDELQFLGKSDQNLMIFILDLKTGGLLRTIDTGIAEAFGGSLYNVTIDTDKGDIISNGRYSDDAIYLGYTKKHTDGTWTKGGVIRIFTHESANPDDWEWSHVIRNIGPVTSAITKLQDRNKKNLWLYFGTGRFFYRLQSQVDDPTGQRTIYGLKEPCYNNTTPPDLGPPNDIDHDCKVEVTSGIENQSADADATDTALPTAATGWYINLANAVDKNGAERIITDPYAVSSGAVFFTTYTPSTDVCSEGGSTAVWAVRYDTGGVVYLSGMALMQVSTGAIHELALKDVFTERGSRRSALRTGMPPKGQGLSVLIGPKPIRKILHIKEK